jgi:hypothetical protein
MNTNQLYLTQAFNIKEIIEAKDLSNTNITNSDTIDSILLNKIKDKIGNKCNHLGYIDKNSIKIISRSMGGINSSQFNGNINYHIKVEANICQPLSQNKIVCKVVGKNKIGIFAVCEPLHIIIASAHHSNTEDFININVNDTVEVEIINYKYKINSKNIKVIGKYIKTM